MAEHKALIGRGQDNRHPDRVRPLRGNDERIIGREKKLTMKMNYDNVL